MGTWVLADLDNIIDDFMGQLQSATEQGWQRTKPDHYRSILAAWSRPWKSGASFWPLRASERGDETASCVAGPRLAVPAWPMRLVAVHEALTLPRSLARQ